MCLKVDPGIEFKDRKDETLRQKRKCFKFKLFKLILVEARECNSFIFAH